MGMRSLICLFFELSNFNCFVFLFCRNYALFNPFIAPRNFALDLHVYGFMVLVSDLCVSCDSDIEEDIRSLQLDSAEDNNGVVNPEDAKPEEVDSSDKMDEGPKQEVQAQPVQAEPKVKDKEVPPVEEEKDGGMLNQKRHLNVVFIGHVVLTSFLGSGYAFCVTKALNLGLAAMC
ncbi:eukaryotic peptide chain release factor GTP-binding subunit ERF3A-like [Senna tora]|uniref:Eukaryotic peptide chain release factor GTP-binding subunit ERF3A-like n=1 Tax=Senna tora TaxID=362788 RepID=A0A834TF85_9FABA|nr:eukaryotic peptide chain release factor GTP-binding subunit ERF3A-like [Senna tora]